MKEQVDKVCRQGWILWEDVKRGLKKDLKDERGATAIEYALVVAVVVVGVVGAATFMFEPLQTFFQGIIEKVTATSQG